MLIFRLVEALNSRLIGPKPWDQIDIIFLKTKWSSRELIRTVWVKWMMNCPINHVLGCLRPEMVVKPGFTK